MAAILPLLAFGLVFAYLLPVHGPRGAIVRATVAWGVLVSVLTELSSLAGALTAWTLGGVWLLTTAGMAGLCWTRRMGIVEWALRWRPPARSWIVLIPIAAAVATIGVVAIAAPPNTWDSMTFHMARVAHWAADRGLSYYPTSIIRQLVESPWSEYAILQLYVLSGGDRLANLVQWFAMAGSVVTISLIAARLGASRRAQGLAAVFVATIPMGILQASSTQTDYVVAFWLLCSIALAMDFMTSPGVVPAAWLGAAVGLSLLTKDTAYIFIAPLALGLGAWGIWKLRSRALLPVVVVAAVAITLNLGYYARNQSAFGWPLGPRAYAALYSNSKLLAPRILASNVIRDVAVQIGTPDPTANAWIERQIVHLHARYLLPVSDSRTTFNSTRFHVPNLSTNEGDAGSPLHLIVLLVAGVAVVVQSIRGRRTGNAPYALGLAAAFLLFALYLKWQPWHARLELPIMVAGGALVGVSPGLSGRRWIAIALSAVLLVASVPWLIDNQTRPLVGMKVPWLLDDQISLVPPGASILTMPRDDQYFIPRSPLLGPYRGAARVLRAGSCRRVGVISGVDDWEYPLWAFTGGPNSGFRFDDVDVGSSRSYGANRLPAIVGTPCEVVDIADTHAPARLGVGAVTYGMIWESGRVAVYRPRSG